MKIQTGKGNIELTVLLAIYSISMVTSLPGLAISPILGDLETIFKGASKLQLQMLESLPSFIIVPFILLAGRLSLHINKRKLLIVGLLIFTICSIIYPFSNTLSVLLFVSALLGIGAGLIIPFSTGLIADYFTGAYRTRQLGLASAINNLTLVLATLLSGFLAGINWHYSFLVYGLSAISLGFAFFLDRQSPHMLASDAPSATAIPENTTTKFKWPVELMIFYYVITFLVLTIPFNLSLYMQNLQIGSADSSGTLISIFFLALMAPGLNITRVISWFKGYTNIISLAAITIGLLCFILTDQIILLTLGVILCGAGYGIMQPIIYDKTADRATPHHATYALSQVMVMNYVAIITYPFILNWFPDNSTYFPFIFSMILACIITVIAWFFRNTRTWGMQVKV